MSDRPENSPPLSETGGWFVPKNAMSEQQLAASADAEKPANDAPMPGATPSDAGHWYVPPEAADRAAALVKTPGNGDGQPEAVATPAAEAPATPMGQPLPQGAALSSEVDYSNYVPGRGFVQPGEAVAQPAEGQAADPNAYVQDAGPEPVAAPAAQPVAAEASPAVPSAASVQPVADSTPVPSDTANQPAAAAVQAAEPAKPVNPELVKRYVDVEKAVQVLRRRYSAGTLTRGQLQDELRKLMILDEDGYWWMIGLESDRWYKYDGKDWIPATRPGKTPEREQSNLPPPVPDAGAKYGAPLLQGSSKPTTVEDDSPLPKQVPIYDPGATMVGKAAPLLDNTLRNSDQPRYFDRARREASSASTFDGGVTMPSGTSQETQPSSAVSGETVPAPYPPGGATTPPADIPAPAPKSVQPDYGEAPKGILADRQRAAGCIIRVAIASVFLALIGTLLLIGAAVFGYFAIVNQYQSKIDSLSTLVSSQSQSLRILDKNGALVYQLNDPNKGARVPVQLSQVSPYMIAATIATEDQRFYDNPGFDIIGLIRAVLANLRSGTGVQGASTITQQLVRALILDPGASQDRSSTRKITEIVVSTEVARRYSKSEILQDYLNSVNYGNLAYGVEAAAQTYFHKSAKDVNIAESAFLAGLVQAPATYNPLINRAAAMARMDDVLKLLAKLGCIQMEHAPYNQGKFCVTQDDINQSIVLVSRVKATTFTPPSNSAKYPHFVNYVQQQLEDQFGKDALYTSGFVVTTTIDPKIQDLAQQAVTSQIAALAGLHVTNGAVLVVRPTDGAILAMVGSADFNNKDISGQFNVTLAPRQPGSSIKPFVYLAAMEGNQSGYFTPATILWDVPTCFGTTPPYCPVNYDNKFHGPQTARNALANSFNVPAVKTLQFVTPEGFQAFGERVGLDFPLTKPTEGGLTSALGGVEVPMINMAQGYSVLATGGNKVGFYSIAKVTRANGDQSQSVFEAKPDPGQRVVEPGLAYLITNILSDNQARQFEFGNALNLPSGRPAAVKTGTTNDSKDNWTIGYTPQLVVAVWVGNSDNSPMIGTSGVTGAAPIWKQVMDGALQGQPAMQFPVPNTVQQVNVCVDFGTQDFQDCPTHKTDIQFAAKPVPPPGDIIKTTPVDSFSGLIANNFCPDYVENRVFLNVSDPTAIDWLNNNPDGKAWATAHKLTSPISQPPTQQCDANTPRPVLKVTNPVPNSSVQGLLQVNGTVSIPNFDHYQLEAGQGLNASQFNIVDGPTKAQAPGDNQFLGRWDTTSSPNGAYTLRLVGFDTTGHHAQVTIPVIVNNLAPGQQPTTAPTGVAPSQPTTTGQVPAGQPTASGQISPGNPTETPIIIVPNPTSAQSQPVAPTPGPTTRSMFPPTNTPHP